MKTHCTHLYRGDGIIWFRIRGYGLLFKDTTKKNLLFSERDRIKCILIGKWIIKILTP